jgi:N-acetylneuraminic acid mutarotase
MRSTWTKHSRRRTGLLVLLITISIHGFRSANAATWTRKADMPTPRWGHSAAVVNGKIYVIGGLMSEPSFLKAESIAAVEEYDPATDTWSRKADMPAPRGYLYGSHPVVDGKIYVTGGGNHGQAMMARVDVYDPATETWTRVADMPTARISMARVAWNEKIYVFGGLTGRLPSPYSSANVTEVYDPQTDIWREAAPMPRGVWEHSALVVEDKIYVVGGANAQDAERILQVYDPRTDTWTNATPFPSNVRGFSASVLYNEIYVFGGWFNSGQWPKADTWLYDPTTDTWTAATPLPDVRSEFSTSVVNGRIYAIGGSPRPHNLQATATVYELNPGFDFTGDGIVDAQDMSVLVDHWHTDSPHYDITGDGIVDVQDLVALSEHLFEDYRTVAHWMLDETEGLTAYDSLGVHDGYVVGNPIWVHDGGQVGGAIELDGVDDYVGTPFVRNPAEGPFSVFAWVRGGAPGQVLVSQLGGADWLATDAFAGALWTGLQGRSRLSGPLLSETLVTDGQWHHVGLTWDGSIRSLYVDDLLVAEDPDSGLIPCEGGLNIGCGALLEPDTFFAGRIDDVHVYNRAITP